MFRYKSFVSHFLPFSMMFFKVMSFLQNLLILNYNVIFLLFYFF